MLLQINLGVVNISKKVKTEFGKIKNGMTMVLHLLTFLKKTMYLKLIMKANKRIFGGEFKNLS